MSTRSAVGTRVAARSVVGACVAARGVVGARVAARSVVGARITVGASVVSTRVAVGASVVGTCIAVVGGAKGLSAKGSVVVASVRRAIAAGGSLLAGLASLLNLGGLDALAVHGLQMLVNDGLDDILVWLDDVDGLHIGSRVDDRLVDRRDLGLDHVASLGARTSGSTGSTVRSGVLSVGTVRSDVLGAGIVRSNVLGAGIVGTDIVSSGAVGTGTVGTGSVGTSAVGTSAVGTGSAGTGSGVVVCRGCSGALVATVVPRGRSSETSESNDGGDKGVANSHLHLERSR